MYFKKPSLETMKKRQEEYKELYSEEIEWFKKNMDMIKENSFLLDMYNIYTPKRINKKVTVLSLSQMFLFLLAPVLGSLSCFLLIFSAQF